MIGAATLSWSVSNPDDEAADGEHAERIELANAVAQIAPGVLLLLHLHQRGGIGALDPDEDGEEIGISHHREKVEIVGQIDGGFGRKLERIAVTLLPGHEMRQEGFHGLLVADEIVVDEIDMAAIAPRVKAIELAQHLRNGLGAWHASVEFDDVAEFAGERAAARELHADMEVLVELQQVPAWARSGGHVGLELRPRVGARAYAGAPVCDELVEHALRFADDLEVGAIIRLGRRTDGGAAHDDGLAVGMRAIDDGERIPLLGQHAAGHHDVRPFEIGRLERFGVAVHQPERPVPRQHGGDGDEAERRRRIFGAYHVAGRLVIPERVGVEAGEHQKDVARILARSSGHDDASL